MNPADVAENKLLVRAELQRMALDELRNAKQLTQVDMAELLDVPQSSVSRIERRADMYLSTLRSYVQAMGGVLQIQAVFPEGGAVLIDRFGEYEDRAYLVVGLAEGDGDFRLLAKPFQQSGEALATPGLKAAGLAKALRALRIGEAQIERILSGLDGGSEIEIGGKLGQRIFSGQDLVAAGFEPVGAGLESARG
jgi:transcriptional regulator with XRE-family HTH domain